MVAPYRHKGEMESLSDEEMLAIFRLTAVMKKALDMTMRPHGYNVGINLGRTAGAGVVGHVHMHIVPRWNGDTNYMPVVSGTKVMPVALEELHEKLTACLARLCRPPKNRPFDRNK
jgi:ATP adenylyltransferase